MKEIQDILVAFSQHQRDKKQTALATVVHVEGSSYRQPGARMLVSEDGQLTGAISGGCLEGDALRKARLAMTQGQNLLVTYDTTDDDDAKLGVGLGCNGIIHILIEPILETNPVNPIQLLKQAVAHRQTAVLLTLFNWQDRKLPQPGTCLLATAQEILTAGLPAAIEPYAQLKAQQALASGKSSMQQFEGLSGFVEVLQPAISLVICGAGNDVLPLVHMANVLGWPTTVVDGRANYATHARFPSASHVLVAKPEQVLEQVPLDNRTAVLLMTHNYNYDLAMLRELLPLEIPYIGVLGPKKKLDRLLTELQETGLEITQEMQQKLFGPTGLELGAETSEEIALSVLAEIKAVLAQAKGGFLREKNAPIHAKEPALPQHD
ncbi:XdhC family protein [Rufibacter sp. LB8]|uniref:XdhC family protein n=1 Tax=Rufibacter sp. LB8 TaxID=2777781 RepID=UPI00178C1A5A|nr:XdhC/CoxI family protein [Rufibacter sp. LB8]